MPPPAGGDGLLAPIPPSAPQQGGPARPWENAGQAEKVQETSDWLAAQRKKLGMELADGFDPKKAAKESAKQRKKTGEDPIIAKLRGMGAFPIRVAVLFAQAEPDRVMWRAGEKRGIGMDGVMDEASQEDEE